MAALIPGREYPAVNVLLQGRPVIFIRQTEKHYFVHDLKTGKDRRLSKAWWTLIVLNFGY